MPVPDDWPFSVQGRGWAEVEAESKKARAERVAAEEKRRGRAPTHLPISGRAHHDAADTHTHSLADRWVSGRWSVPSPLPTTQLCWPSLPTAPLFRCCYCRRRVEEEAARALAAAHAEEQRQLDERARLRAEEVRRSLPHRLSSPITPPPLPCLCPLQFTGACSMMMEC